jgi:8-oxo-dGTP pyrophosphatase MutT (NUDIX family)
VTSSSSSYVVPLTVVKNAYGDLQTTRPGEFSSVASIFDAQLLQLLGRPDADRGVWLRLPWSLNTLVPVAAAHGFTPHHFSRASDSLILQWWCPNAGDNPTPRYAHVDHGCGAVVVNKRGEILAVKERFGSGGWNLPGGHLDEGEDMLTCAAREAREETGVRVEALGAIGLHETQYDAMPAFDAPREPGDDARVAAAEHAARWGATHHGMWVLCCASDEALQPDPSEIAEARWLRRDEWRGAFSAPVNLLVETAYASGQVAAAAEAANGTLSSPIPYLIVAHGTLLNGKRGPRDHTFYCAQPQDVVLSAMKAAGAVGDADNLAGGQIRQKWNVQSGIRAFAIMTLAVSLGFILGRKS